MGRTDGPSSRTGGGRSVGVLPLEVVHRAGVLSAQRSHEFHCSDDLGLTEIKLSSSFDHQSNSFFLAARSNFLALKDFRFQGDLSPELHTGGFSE